MTRRKRASYFGSDWPDVIARWRVNGWEVRGDNPHKLAMVRPAGKPRVGQWVLMWQAPGMRTPAFDYCDDEMEARLLLQIMFTETAAQRATLRKMIARHRATRGEPT